MTGTGRRLASKNALTPAALVATWFGVGLLPRAPGTWGSLAALPLAWAIDAAGGRVALIAAAALVFGLGWWASDAYERQTGQHDPGSVVVDEVAGQWLTLAFVPLAPWSLAAGFVLFRAADIFKPWPVSLADRRLKGGLGVMADDILAAVYAGLGLIVIAWSL